MSDTRETILEVSKRLFISQGYTATSIRQIASETGIGKATVYHHFTDKKAIILALMEREGGGHAELLEAIRAETDPRRRIETAVQGGIRRIFEMMDFFQIVRREVPGGHEALRAIMLPFLAEFRSLLCESIVQGAERGIFRPVDANQSARVLMTMIQGSFAVAYLTGDRPSSPEQAAKALLDIYFHGISQHEDENQ